MIARKFTQSVVASGFLLAGIATWSIPTTPSAYAKAGDRTFQIEGTLLAVDATAGTVSISVRSGTVVVTANRSTRIERNGRRTILPNLEDVFLKLTGHSIRE